LGSIEILSHNQKENLIRIFDGDYDEMWRRFDRRHETVKNTFGLDKYSFLESRFSESTLYRTLETLKTRDISFVTPHMGQYPKKLTEIQGKPFALFYRGDISLLNETTVCLAGTRKNSGYGRKVVNLFVDEFTAHKMAIIGGLSLGIESIAHSKALSSQGKTIALLPAGFLNVYPSENLNLYKQIAENGLVISEYPPEARLNGIYFEQRNRLLAALSNAVVFVEAGEKSGVFSIFDYAAEFSREIFVIPGDIFEPASKGTNDLIKSYSSLVATHPGDVIKALKTVYQPQKKRYENIVLNSHEKQIINLLYDEDGCTFNDLKERTGIDVGELGYILSCLELTGIVRKEVNCFKLNTEVINEISNS
jgi:DNA processing protein